MCYCKLLVVFTYPAAVIFLAQTHEFVLPQDDLYIISWVTQVGEFPNLVQNESTSANCDSSDNPENFPAATEQKDQGMTNVDL